MVIKILGVGCPNCDKLEALARQAATELNISAKFVKVKDVDQILDYGVLRTPGLVINEQLKSSGKLPALSQIKTWIQESKTSQE